VLEVFIIAFGSLVCTYNSFSGNAKNFWTIRFMVAEDISFWLSYFAGVLAIDTALDWCMHSYDLQLYENKGRVITEYYLKFKVRAFLAQNIIPKLVWQLLCDAIVRHKNVLFFKINPKLIRQVTNYLIKFSTNWMIMTY